MILCHQMRNTKSSESSFAQKSQASHWGGNLMPSSMWPGDSQEANNQRLLQKESLIENVSPALVFVDVGCIQKNTQIYLKLHCEYIGIHVIL